MSWDGLEGQEGVLRVSKGCLGSMCGGCVEGVWRVSGECLVVLYGLSVVCLGSVWGVSGWCLGCLRQPHLQLCKWRHLVVIFAINASDVTWWLNSGLPAGFQRIPVL